MNKIVSVDVYKGRYGDCSNGGLSAKTSYLDLYPADTLESDLTEQQLATAVKVVVRTFGGEKIAHVEPVTSCPADKVGYMAGGCLVSTSDSRWSAEVERALGYRFYGGLSLHDRSETPEQYRALSN